MSDMTSTSEKDPKREIGEERATMKTSIGYQFTYIFIN